MSTRPAVGTIVGAYRLAERIGAGGMGEVFRAEPLAGGPAVAVKVFSSETIDARELARFYQEARIHRSLVHPNIAVCHELVTVDRTPCLIMELLGGESLAERISRSGRLSAADALAAVRDLARAVAYAHAQGIVHRDIKPANARATVTGELKLLDFGIARTGDVRGLTAVGHVIGTPQYLSPEQFVGSVATPASDVWALGVLLYEAVVGVTPFDGATPDALWAQVNQARVVLPSERVADHDAHLLRAVDALVSECLVRDPRRRRLSAAALAVRADAALRGTAGGPRVARTVRIWPGTPPWLRGRRTLVWFAVAAMLGLAAFWSQQAPDIPEAERGLHHIDANRHAVVYVNGRRSCETPCDYVGRLGELIDVRVEATGAPVQQARIEITSNGTTTFTLPDGNPRR